ncbi:MAG: diguanylate cyclase [Tardiphaga sp.]
MRALMQKLALWLHTVEDHLTLRVQFAAAATAICVILVGTLATGAAFISYRDTSALLRKNLSGIAAGASGRLDRFMAIRQQELELFSKLEPLQSLWLADPVELRGTLEQLQGVYSDFAWIGFADIDGKVVASTGGLLQGRSVGERPWFKEGLQRMAIGDVHEAVMLASLLGQRPVNEPYRFVDLAMPVRDAEGKLLGVLGGHLNWDWAARVIDDTEEHTGAPEIKLSVISKLGTVLVGPDKESVKYTGERLDNILATREGTFAERVAGRQMLTAFHVGSGHQDYKGLNWIVTAWQPASIALAAAIDSAQVILMIGGLIALVGISLAVLVSRRIARPILEIAQEADRIGRVSGPTMLARRSGSTEVVQLSHALRSLLRRVGVAEERTKEVELRATENTTHLQDDMLKLQTLANTDFLTGVMNRRAFLAAADDAMQHCRRYQRGMATLMIDIDHFKKINDAHGHAAGDEVIKRVAEIVARTIRTSDKAARFGGEEFVVLLREIDEPAALMLAERIRQAIEISTIEGDGAIPATVSIGLALFEERDRDVPDMIERSDQGLYIAKQTGRNCVVLMPGTEASSANAA